MVSEPESSDQVPDALLAAPRNGNESAPPHVSFAESASVIALPEFCSAKMLTSYVAGPDGKTYDGPMKFAGRFVPPPAKLPPCTKVLVWSTLPPNGTQPFAPSSQSPLPARFVRSGGGGGGSTGTDSRCSTETSSTISSMPVSG